MAENKDDKEALLFRGSAGELETARQGTFSRVQLLWAICATAIVVVWFVGLQVYEPGAAVDIPKPIVAENPQATQLRPAVGPAADTLMPEQLAWRDQALTAIEELTPRLRKLERQAVLHWAEVEYKALQETVESGEQAYAEQRFRDARDLYEKGVAQVEKLEKQVPTAFAAYRKKGIKLLAEKRYDEALAVLDIAGLIDPEDKGVAAGINTARHGEAVDRLLTKGNFALDQKLPQDAMSFSKEASSLDPVRADIQKLMAKASEMARQHAYSAQMKSGYAALEAKRFPEALTAFNRAVALAPKSREASAALETAKRQQTTEKLDGLRQAASAAMEQQAWEDAQRLYTEALAIREDLAFAATGLKKATFYRDKTEQTTALLAKPDRLADRTVAAHTAGIIAELEKDRALPPRLAEAKNKLKTLLTAYKSPVAVTVYSDGRSNISIIRGDSYQPFRKKTIEFTPGSYILLARRRGYRDRRVSFEVPLDGQPVTVSISADEKI